MADIVRVGMRLLRIRIVALPACLKQEDLFPSYEWILRLQIENPKSTIVAPIDA